MASQDLGPDIWFKRYQGTNNCTFRYEKHNQLASSAASIPNYFEHALHKHPQRRTKMKNIHTSLLHIPRFLVAATAANPRQSPVASAAVREASGKLAITKKGSNVLQQ